MNKIMCPETNWAEARSKGWKGGYASSASRGLERNHECPRKIFPTGPAKENVSHKASVFPGISLIPSCACSGEIGI